MTREEFIKIINRDNFSYHQEDDIFVCDDDINISMKLIHEHNKTFDLHTYLDDTKEVDLCHLVYYYNQTRIYTTICIYSRKFFGYKALYLPISNYYDKNGNIAKVLESELYFKFNKKKIESLNQLLGIPKKDVEFIIEHLESKTNVLFE